MKSNIMSSLLTFALILGFSLGDLGSLFGYGEGSGSTASASSFTLPDGGMNPEQRTRAILGAP